MSGLLEQNRKSGQLTCYLNRTTIGAVNTERLLSPKHPVYVVLPHSGLFLGLSLTSGRLLHRQSKHPVDIGLYQIGIWR